MTNSKIEEIAKDIGRDVVYYIEEMYPGMLEAVAKNSAKTSISRVIAQKIMSAFPLKEDASPEEESKQPYVTIPLSKSDLLSYLYGIAGVLRTGQDYKAQTYNLLQDIIDLVEANNNG